MALSAPQPLAEHHLIGDFKSGITSLDDWLKRRARSNQASGAARCFVLCKGERVVGYYALASGAIGVRLRRGACDAKCLNLCPSLCGRVRAL